MSPTPISQEFINEAAEKMIFRGEPADYEVVLQGIRDGQVVITVTEEGMTVRATPARPREEVEWTSCAHCGRSFSPEDLDEAECLEFDDGTVTGPWCPSCGPRSHRRRRLRQEGYPGRLH
jgi:hypothetical protein